jgi:hypothetical protein
MAVPTAPDPFALSCPIYVRGGTQRGLSSNNAPEPFSLFSRFVGPCASESRKDFASF